MLQVAVDVSERAPGALSEQARFHSVVRDSPATAEALYREASQRALQALEESWAGLIEALGEQDKTEEAARLAERARQLFPQSPLLAEALRFARLGE
jgi:hypothetical protein